jgi:hypothetical protein
MRIVIAYMMLAALGGISAVAQEKKPAERSPDLSLTAIGRQHHSIQTKSVKRKRFSIKASRCSMASIMKKPRGRFVAPASSIQPHQCLSGE